MGIQILYDFARRAVDHFNFWRLSMAVLQNASKTPDGVMLNGFLLSPVVDQCEGCDRIRDFEEEKFCSSYPNPASKWAGGRCNFATHAKIEVAAQAKVNPLKASKRAAKGR